MIDTIGRIPETIRSNHRRYLPGKTLGYDDDSPDQERRLLLIKHTGIWNEFKKKPSGITLFPLHREILT
jgi:hypothetical protein